jgi:probable selenium-dependent hydroxylase accessory protein YqeC
VDRILDALGVRPGDVVAAAGAGGKTTLIGRLADEARLTGLTAIVTATTHMGGLADPGLPVVMDSDGDADRQIERALAARDRVWLLGERLREDKLRGVAPERVDGLVGRADLLLVEADGARGRPLKAPGPHEPVLPASTTLLVVVSGLDAIGRPFGPEAVHRFEIAAARTGAVAGRPIDETLLADVLRHPESYPSRRSPGVRLALFLNKADCYGGPHAVERLAGMLAPAYDCVVAGSAALGWAQRIA